MKRIINIRPLFIAFVGLVLGILMFTLFWLTNGLTSFIVGGLIATITLFSAAFLLLAFLTKGKTRVTNTLAKHKFHFVLFLVFVLIGHAFMGLNYLYYENTFKEYDGQYYVIGEINDNYYEKYGYTFLTLSNAVITNETTSEKLPSNVNVVVFDSGFMDNTVNASYYMEFHATLNKVPFSNAGYNFSNYINGEAYNATIVNNSYNFYSGDFALNELVRNEYKTTLNQNLSSEMASLSYSLMFGSNEGLSSEITNLFTATGVVHIISVSGLHVAVLVAALVLMLKAFKVKKKPQIIIIVTVLMFYAYLCGFVPSVVRASVMSIILLLAINLGERYDGLSALSLSGILLLLVNPVSLFSLGFQLSFLSVFAIITLVPYLNKLFRKIHLPKMVYAPISVTIAVTFLTFPILAHFFNQIAIYSVFGNLLAVPLMSIAYVLLLLFSTISMLLPFMGFLLFIPQVLLHSSVLVLQILENLPLSTIKVFSDGYWSVLILLLFAFVVKFVMAKPLVKTVMIALLLSAVVGTNVYYNLPVTFHNNAITLTYQNDSNVNFVSTNSGKHILVGAGFNNQNYFENLVNELRINKIHAVIAYDYSFKYHDDLIELCKEYNVENLYVVYVNEDLHDYISSQFSFTNVTLIASTQIFSYDNITFKPIIDTNAMLALELNVNNNNILVVKNALTTAQLRTLGFAVLPSYDVVLINNITANLLEFDIVTNKLITMKNNSTSASNVYNLKELSNLTIKL